MKAFGIRLKQGLLYAGLSCESYEEIKPAIWQKNYNALLWASALGATLLAALAAASFVIAGLAGNRTLYFALLAVMATHFFICKRFVVSKKSRALPLLYVLLSSSYLFAILIGTVLQPELPATTFHVLLFALPLILVDRPFRSTLLLTGAAIGFCACAAAVKPPAIARQDFVNTASFLFLGIAINYHVTQTKLRDLVNRSYMERERDTDGLTRLLTKDAGVRRIRAYLAETASPAALVILDVDNFKAVNDTLGHAYGDAVLRIMGECIQKTFRKTDVLSRFGGDEFVFLLPEAETRASVEARISRLIEQMKERLSSQENASEITGSFGIALYPADAGSYDALFRKADEALYVSKELGKNRCTFYPDHRDETP